jgi:hypothetical protein
MILKIAGGLLLLFSLLPGALSLWQGYAAYQWSNGALAEGKYGELGRELAERGAEIRRNRALIAGGASFLIGVTGLGLLVAGLRSGRRAQRVLAH